MKQQNIHAEQSLWVLVFAPDRYIFKSTKHQEYNLFDK